MLLKTLQAFSAIAIFITICTTSALADSHFKMNGKLDSFKWAPPNYTTGFEYDVFYYIPQSVAAHPELKAKSILFMHGGGQSTMTREGASNTVKLYTDDFIQIAENQHLIVVLPSSSGLNWGGHTRNMIRELAKLMRSELPIDPNSMALIGHSMGGMGITRNAHLLADQFAFTMPISAGMDPAAMTESNLLSFFNVPYHHVQGIHDSFAIFVERAKLHELKMKEIETKLGLKSKFELTLTGTDHQYNLDQLDRIIRTQFKKSTRNLYQPDLYGTFTYTNQINTENNIKFNSAPTADYFWIEAKKFNAAAGPTRSAFEAHLKGNRILIELKGKHNIQKLRVYLSQKMLNFQKPISIIVDKTYRFYGNVEASLSRSIKTMLVKRDQGFKFDQYIDVDVSNSIGQ